MGVRFFLAAIVALFNDGSQATDHPRVEPNAAAAVEPAVAADLRSHNIRDVRLERIQRALEPFTDERDGDSADTPTEESEVPIPADSGQFLQATVAKPGEILRIPDTVLADHLTPQIFKVFPSSLAIVGTADQRPTLTPQPRPALATSGIYVTDWRIVLALSLTSVALIAAYLMQACDRNTPSRSR